MHQPMLPFEQEKVRLSEQCGVILRRLEIGPVTNSELSRIALNYTARLSDLRHKGFDVRCIYRDRSSGLSTYKLFGRTL